MEGGGGGGLDVIGNYCACQLSVLKGRWQRRNYGTQWVFVLVGCFPDGYCPKAVVLGDVVSSLWSIKKHNQNVI